MLLVYGLLFSEKLASAFNRNALRIIRIGSCHYLPHIVLTCSGKHASRAFATAISVIIRNVIECLVTVSLCLLEQFIKHIVLLWSFLLDFVDKSIHILVLRSQ